METIVKVKVPTYKTIVEIEGKDLVLHFRQLKRNEKLKIQIDINRAVDLLKKENKTPEEEALVKKAIDDGNNRAIELLESVEGQVSIGGEVITLESIRAGELPEVVYAAIDEAFKELNVKLNNLKAEAESKNDAPLSGSPLALVKS